MIGLYLPNFQAIAHANGITKSSSTTMANWLGTSVTGTDREKRGKVLEELVNTELQFITDMNCFTEASLFPQFLYQSLIFPGSRKQPVIVAKAESNS